MGNVRIFAVCLVGLSVLIFSSPAFGGTPWLDPGIPNGETITYVSRTGDDTTTVVEEVTIKKDGEKNLYEITSTSKRLDRKIQLLKENMSIVSIHTVRKFQAVTLDSTLKVIEEKPDLDSGETKLADFSVLTYILRGFPFDKLETLKIGYYGEQKKNSYSMRVNCKGKEKIKVQSGVIDCYKLEFSMDGFWGTFLPKMNAWYTIEAPHYLVYYEGPDGPPGTPRRVMEMIQYRKPSM